MIFRSLYIIKIHDRQERTLDVASFPVLAFADGFVTVLALAVFKVEPGPAVGRSTCDSGRSFVVADLDSCNNASAASFACAWTCSGVTLRLEFFGGIPSFL